MALDSYSGLQGTIADFLMRADLTAAIPAFITLGEAQINRRLIAQVRDGKPIPRRFVVRSDASVDQGAEYIPLPTDFIGPMSLTIKSQFLDLRYVEPQSYQREKMRSCQYGKPEIYTVIGGNFQIHPVSDVAYTFELLYYGRIPRLSNANTTNWVLADHPDAYLYAALGHSAPYLKEDARLTTWEALAASALNDICLSDPMPTNKVTLRTEVPHSREHSFWRHHNFLSL